ncbi:MAG: hypothetical protein ACK5LX_11535 [Oscillospiraceae bacterium]
MDKDQFDVIANSYAPDGSYTDIPLKKQVEDYEAAKGFADVMAHLHSNVRVVYSDDYKEVTYTPPASLQPHKAKAPSDERFPTNVLDTPGHFSHEWNVIGLYEKENKVPMAERMMQHFPSSTRFSYVPAPGVEEMAIHDKYTDILGEYRGRYEELFSLCNILAGYEGKSPQERAESLIEYSPSMGSYVPKEGVTGAQISEQIMTHAEKAMDKPGRAANNQESDLSAFVQGERAAEYKVLRSMGLEPEWKAPEQEEHHGEMEDDLEYER